MKAERINKNLLSTIEEIANLGVYEVNLQSGYWTGSDNFIKIFGLPEKEKYTQKEFQNLVHPDDFEDVMSFFEKCLEEQRDFIYEYRCVTTVGELIYVNSRSKIYYDQAGNPLKVVGIKQNISEQKEIELKLARLNKLLQRKNRVLGEVAHDLRAPLSQINALSMLLKDKLEGEQGRLFDYLLDSCDTTDHLIDELIEISELETTHQKITASLSDLNDLIKKSVTRFQTKLVEKQLDIKKDFDPEAVASVNREKISRVIDNLLSNAIKFSHRNSTIELVTERCADKVILKIKDEGIGIDHDHLPRIFENPHKIRRAGTEGEQSTGFGLSIVKQIVDLHQGTISVNSTLNKGTTFTIVLNQIL